MGGFNDEGATPMIPEKRSPIGDELSFVVAMIVLVTYTDDLRRVNASTAVIS